MLTTHVELLLDESCFSIVFTHVTTLSKKLILFTVSHLHMSGCVDMLLCLQPCFTLFCDTCTCYIQVCCAVTRDSTAIIVYPPLFFVASSFPHFVISAVPPPFISLDIRLASRRGVRRNVLVAMSRSIDPDVAGNVKGSTG